MSNSIATLLSPRLSSYFSMLCSSYCFVHWPDDCITQIPSPMKSIHENRLTAETVKAGDMLKKLGSMIEGMNDVAQWIERIVIWSCMHQ